MISHLDGKIDAIEEDTITIDVGGIGFEVYVAKIPGLSEGAQMLIHTVWQIKEDGVTIFGFATRQESELFKTITSKVSGVGGKTALTILKSLSPAQIAEAVIHEKAHVFRAISGIGPKMSERIVLELRDVMSKMTISSVPSGGDEMDEARAALRSLGFSIGEVEKALSGVKAHDLKSEEIIKVALGKLSGGK